MAKAKPFYDAYVKKFNANPDYLDSALAYMSLRDPASRRWPRPASTRRRSAQAIATDTFDTINGPVKFEGVQNATTPTAFLQFQNGEAAARLADPSRDRAVQAEEGW